MTEPKKLSDARLGEIMDRLSRINPPGLFMAEKEGLELLSHCDALTAENEKFKTEEICYGCKDPFVWHKQIFRCVDCETAFHKHCLKKHCASDLDRLSQECAVYREALEQITNPVDCIACSTDGVPDHVLCTCADEDLLPYNIAKEALAKGGEIRAVSGNRI